MYVLIILKCLDCQPYVATTDTFNTVQACLSASQIEATKLTVPPYRMICAPKERISYYLGRNRA